MEAISFLASAIGFNFFHKTLLSMDYGITTCRSAASNRGSEGTEVIVRLQRLG